MKKGALSKAAVMMMILTSREAAASHHRQRRHLLRQESFLGLERLVVFCAPCTVQVVQILQKFAFQWLANISVEYKRTSTESLKMAKQP